MQRWALELGRSCERLSGQARLEKADAATFSVWIDSEENSEKEGKDSERSPAIWSQFGSLNDHVETA